MLNKIRVIGKLLKTEEKNVDDYKPNKIYFSLLVYNPSSSLTVLRCVADNEDLIRKISGEISSQNEGEEKTFLVKGYLRNEKETRHIIVIAKSIEDYEIEFNKSNIEESNKVRLLGKVIKIMNESASTNSGPLSFQIVVVRENSFNTNIAGSNSSKFFCRIQSEEESSKKIFTEKISKGNLILIEGYLQTKKIPLSNEEKFSRISSIICTALVKIDSESSNNFEDLDLTLHRSSIKKIDFSNPKK